MASAKVNAAQTAIQNDYIVVFRADESDPDGTANALVRAHGGSLTHIYRTALKGFAVAGLPDAAVEALQRNSKVVRVERDAIVTADDAGVEAPTPSWGLDRIDATTGLNQSYTYPNDGTGVTAYIIDTGINATSADFTGRIGTGVDEVDGGAPDDCNGHGTHVAGTVGGTKYGVAKNVRIVSVRVLNCQGSGTNSGVIAGIDWVAQNRTLPAVANMSLGGGFSQTLNDAVTAAIGKGVVFAIAAGNSTRDACNYSPASTPNAITVGATTSSDALASYSNFGPCVDINAPGSSITSDWIGSSTATNTISGTSMATPHVTGAAALYLFATPDASPTAVASGMVAGASSGVIGGALPSGTPNKLLNVSFIGGTTGGGSGGSSPPTAPPLSKSCAAFSCTFSTTATGVTYEWTFVGGNAQSPQTDAGPYTVTYKPRETGSVTLKVSNANGTSPATTVSVTCNPKKCQ
jgi:subtilisin family serine protease